MREGDNGQIARAAARFGAVAAAGEIATQLGVVPWPIGTAHRASLECFEQWAEGFGRQGAREERQVLETVRNAIQANLARFGSVVDRHPLDDEEGDRPRPREGEARALTTLGYVHEIGMKAYYLFHEAGWAEILRGFDLRHAADTLIALGLMLTGDGGRRQRRQRISGGVSPRFYTVSADILEYDGSAPVQAATPAAEAADLSDPFGYRWRDVPGTKGQP
jgi:hypothetical protein